MPKDINRNLAGKTFLVVEDNPVSTEYLKIVLENKGINLIFTTIGEEAIEIVANNDNIDLVLMDIRLPGIDGYKATKEIKKLRKDLPVIAQTAYALKGDREKALEAGCNAHISKPIIATELLDLITRTLYS